MINLVIKLQLEELRLRLACAEDRLSGHERRHSLAGEMSRDDRESVLASNERLTEENDRLKKYAVLCQRRHKRESDTLVKEAEARAAEAGQRKAECDHLREKLAAEASTSRFLREDLTKNVARAAAAERRCGALEKELESVRDGADSRKETER